MTNQPDWKYFANKFEISSKSCTGIIWKAKPETDQYAVSWNKRYVGTIAGSISTDQEKRKYYAVGISDKTDGIQKKTFVHRIIYMIFHQIDIPEGMSVGHIDGNTLNNNPDNLVLRNSSDNLNNSKMNKNNKSGIRGVHFDSIKNKWIGQITVNYKKIIVGRFDSKDEAAKAVEKAREKLCNN